MIRALALGFAAIAYAVFLATFLYLIAFVGDLPAVPRTVDAGPAGPVPAALAIDAGLILLFAVQHSAMAGKGFKRAWTRIVPAPIERSTYVLFASAVLIALYAFWRPIGGTIWQIGNAAGQAAMWALFACGWLILLASTFLINHFELFGLQQVYLHARHPVSAAPVFRQPLFYKLVRRPLYVGFFIAFWAAPTMSVGHLLLAGGLSAFMLVAIRFEERDLVGAFGADYEGYQRDVGMLVPSLGRKRA